VPDVRGGGADVGHLDGDPAVHPGGGEGLVDDRAVAVAGRGVDEVEAVQRGQVDRSAGGERVVGADDEIHRRGGERGDPHRGGGGTGDGDEGEVEVPVGDRGDQPLRAGGRRGEPQRDVGVAAVELAEQRGHVDQPDRGERADPHGAAQAAPHLVHGVAGVPGGVDRGTGVREQRGPGVGEVDPTGGAVQQPGTDLALQRLHGGGDRGLHDQQPRGGGGEGPLLRDRDEGGQVTQLHPINLST
jgi:hypothetical protein